MKRRVLVRNEPPASLRVFEPPNALRDEAEVAVALEALAAWREARKRYYADHGWPSDFVGMLQEHVQVSHTLLAESGPGRASSAE